MTRREGGAGIWSPRFTRLPGEITQRVIPSAATGLTLIRTGHDPDGDVDSSALGVIPLVINSSAKAAKANGSQLRETLRSPFSGAIDEFHRDTFGMVCTGTTAAADDPPRPPA